MPRAAIALLVSLMAHAALVPLLWLSGNPAPKRAAAGGPAPRLTLSEWEPPRAKAIVPMKDYLMADAIVGVGRAPLVSEVPSHSSGAATLPAIAAAPRPSSPSALSPAGSARRIVWLIDRSMSMGPSGGLATARRELSRALLALPSDARFQVLFYNQGAEALLPPGMHPITSVASALARLGDFPASGKTDHLNALRHAMQLRPDCVCLVTDAADMPTSQIRDAERLFSAGTTLHVIEVSNKSVPSSALARLAVKTGGSHRKIASE